MVYKTHTHAEQWLPERNLQVFNPVYTAFTIHSFIGFPLLLLLVTLWFVFGWLVGCFRSVDRSIILAAAAAAAGIVVTIDFHLS